MSDESRQTPLDDLLRDYDPEPSHAFYAAMADRPWQRQPPSAPPEARPDRPRRHPQAPPKGHPQLRRWAIGAVVAVALALSAPPVRAMVSGWLGVGRATSESVPIAASDELYEPAQPGQIAALSARVGWPVATPARLPAGYRLESAVEDSSNEMVIVTYLASRQIDASSGLTATSALTLVESRHNTRVPLQVAPSTAVEQVALGDGGGAYAVGAWDSEYDPQTDAFVARWRSDLAVVNLFWERGGIYFLLTTDDPAVSKADLIVAAESMIIDR